VNDRIRAKAPATDIDSWAEAVVLAVGRDEGRFELTVSPVGGNKTDTVIVTVTPAVFDLFTGRLEPPAAAPTDVVDATVWFK
jgi:hypothetical protein